MAFPFQYPRPYPAPSSELCCLLAAGEAPRRMQIGFENKGSTSRLREQRCDPKFRDLWPVYALCSWLLQLCWWLFLGSHRPKPCSGVVHSKSHCPEAGSLPESCLWNAEREKKKEGAGALSWWPALSSQALRALKARLAKLQPCQALAQQLRTAPEIPNKGKIIAVSSYNQLAAQRSHRGEFCFLQLSTFKNGRLGWSSACKSQS